MCSPASPPPAGPPASHSPARHVPPGHDRGGSLFFPGISPGGTPVLIFPFRHALTYSQSRARPGHPFSAFPNSCGHPPHLTAFCHSHLLRSSAKPFLPAYFFCLTKILRPFAPSHGIPPRTSTMAFRHGLLPWPSVTAFCHTLLSRPSSTPPPHPSAGIYPSAIPRRKPLLRSPGSRRQHKRGCREIGCHFRQPQSTRRYQRHPHRSTATPAGLARLKRSSGPAP